MTTPPREYGVALIVVAVCLAPPCPVSAGQSQRPASKPTPVAHELGIEGYGVAGLNWPSAPDSFEAAGLDARPIELGGGAQVTDLWRNLFAQVSASKWSSTGERSFVDAAGTRFPLGIPLEVSATYVDVSAGWKFYPRSGSTGRSVWPYLGGGAGIVMYSEKSPFQQPGDDLDTRKTSYHVFGGAEVPVSKWFGIAVEMRYRYTPGLLGDGGVSNVLAEEAFGEFQLGAGLRIGFGGANKPHVAPPRRPPTAPAAEQEQKRPRAPETAASAAVVNEKAPVFLFPDARRTPLRTLEPGTVLRILGQTGDWLRVEFADRQYGPRQGYIERKYVRLKE